MAKNVIKLTESDIRKMVKDAIRIIKEEKESQESYWESPDGSEKAWEKVEVSTSKEDNTDPSMDTDWSKKDLGFNTKDLSGTLDSDSDSNSDSDDKDDNSYDSGDFDFDNDSTDVKDNDNSEDGPKGDAVADGDSNKSNGTQFNQGGDPFSQKVGDTPSGDDNGATTKGKNDGWGTSLDSIINDEIKKATESSK